MPTLTTRVGAGAVAAGAALLLAVAGPATASTVHGSTRLGAAVRMAPAATSTSTTQAGYFGTLVASAKSTATFVVPALTCPASGTEGQAPGAFLFGSGSSDFTAGGVLEACSSGSPVYEALVVLEATQTPLSQTVNPGDSITVTVTATASKGIVKIADTTGGWSKTTKGAGGSFSGGTGVVGMDSLVNSNTGKALKLAKFASPDNFSASTLDGKSLAAAGATQTNLVSSKGKVLILTSALDSTGKKFSETFKAA